MKSVRVKHLFLPILITTLFLGGLFVLLVPNAHAVTVSQPEIVVQVPIPVPGVTFDCVQQPGKICVRSLGDYIGGYYRFFAGAVGIISALMVMWGGIRWITAMGNASRVKEAKDTIYGAIISLIITFGSYIILFTINPELVKLKLPNVENITGISLSAFKCSENPLADIDFSTCDPRSDSSVECCGKTLRVNTGNGEARDCLWDICNNSSDVCANLTGGSDLGARYGCISAFSYCVEKAKDDRREWCPAADVVIQNAKTVQGAKKFVNTGCAFWDVAGGDKCRWSLLLSSVPLPQLAFPTDYQPQFIDCYTPGARGVCWEEQSGQDVAMECEGSRQRCKNPTDATRPVAGADGGCLVKVGAPAGSMDPDDYRCWQVPYINPSDDPKVNPL